MGQMKELSTMLDELCMWCATQGSGCKKCEQRVKLRNNTVVVNGYDRTIKEVIRGK